MCFCHFWWLCQKFEWSFSCKTKPAKSHGGRKSERICRCCGCQIDSRRAKSLVRQSMLLIALNKKKKLYNKEKKFKIGFRVQTTGLGGMKPNTVILGWPYGWRQSEDDKTWQVFLNTVRIVAAARMALLVPKGINFFPDSSEKVRSILIY